MATKIFVVFCLLGLVVAPNVAWSARWSRGECVDAVRQKYGTYAADTGHTFNRAAVRRCMRHGPGSV
jgi:hypothetical protein